MRTNATAKGGRSVAGTKRTGTKAKANVPNFEHSFRVGDILLVKWGWGTYSVSWYEVVGVTPKNVRIRPIKENVRREGWDGYSTPAPGMYTSDYNIPKEGATKRVYKWVDEDGVTEYIKIGDHNAYRWDGTEQFVSSYD